MKRQHSNLNINLLIATYLGVRSLSTMPSGRPVQQVEALCFLSATLAEILVRFFEQQRIFNCRCVLSLASSADYRFRKRLQIELQSKPVSGVRK